MQEPNWQAIRHGLMGYCYIFKDFKKKTHGRFFFVESIGLLETEEVFSVHFDL
jgi:hypothetical protein